MIIDINLPDSWAAMTQQQLRQLLDLMVMVQAENNDRRFSSMESYSVQTAAQIATKLLLLWSDLELVSPYGDGYLLRYGEHEFVLSAQEIASAIQPLMWIRELPVYPVRLDSIAGAQAAAADLSHDFPFDRWLAVENNWQAYQASQDPRWLKAMAAILYEKDDISPDSAELLGVFYWWAAVKTMVGDMFPNFFKAPSSDDSSPLSVDDLRRSMDTQIRALTKGDITKESMVLSMETMRALTELDALAREYDEMKKIYSKS